MKSMKDMKGSRRCRGGGRIRGFAVQDGRCPSACASLVSSLQASLINEPSLPTGGNGLVCYERAFRNLAPAHKNRNFLPIHYQTEKARSYSGPAVCEAKVNSVWQTCLPKQRSPQDSPPWRTRRAWHDGVLSTSHPH
jgi:hypothetical protein